MVEWKKLRDVCTDFIVPMRDRPKVFDGTIPWCRIEDIEGMYFNKSLSGLKVSDSVIKAMNLKIYPTGTVICSCSATLGVCAINTQPLITNQTFIGLVCSDKIQNRFLYYYMLTRKKELLSLSTTGTIPYVSREKFEKMDVPVPSLAEQQRIVGILDTFTASIDNLKEQIAQRRKQYEYYRDQLLDLEGKPGVEMKTLGEICDIKGRIGFRGYTREDQVAEGEGVVSLSPGNIENGKMTYDVCTHITWKKYYESPEIMTFDGDIIFCKTGSTVGKVAMVNNLPCEATINPQLVVLKNVSVNSSFLNNSLGSFRIQSIVKRLAGVGSVPNISQEKLGNLEILLPSLQEQQRIVNILDTFEASIQNLEAQLKEREKQYEYYRNKLLTFE